MEERAADEISRRDAERLRREARWTEQQLANATVTEKLAGAEKVAARKPSTPAELRRTFREHALEKARPKLTAAFRRHVIAMAPGDRIHWGDMETWTEAQCPPGRQMIDPDRPWDDPWYDFIIDCMVICGAMAKERWLNPTPWPDDYDPKDPSKQHWKPDDYIRTDKPAP